MNNDSELLRQHVEGKSKDAFAELVQRHVGLVYGVALRRLGGDAHLAEEVAQSVFTDMARKAASLQDRATLTGWLYASALVASAGVVRAERRRKTREFTAHVMQTTLATDDSADDWIRMRPIIDEAMVELKEEDREALMLRFFEANSFPEVGTALRITEEAARKRVNRALDTLRVALARRGVTSSGVMLGMALAGMSAITVPAGLGARIAGQALTTLAVPPVASTAGTGLLSSLWPPAAALIVGAFLVGSQLIEHQRLREEIVELRPAVGFVANLQAETRDLARRLADEETAMLRLRNQQPIVASASAPIPAVQSVPASAGTRLRLSAEGTISWNDELITLDEFIGRLQKLQADPRSRVAIRAASGFPALNYVLDEVRKAEISHVTVDSATELDAKAGQLWF